MGNRAAWAGRSRAEPTAARSFPGSNQAAAHPSPRPFITLPGIGKPSQRRFCPRDVAERKEGNSAAHLDQLALPGVRKGWKHLFVLLHCQLEGRRRRKGREEEGHEAEGAQGRGAPMRGAAPTGGLVLGAYFEKRQRPCVPASPESRRVPPSPFPTLHWPVPGGFPCPVPHLCVKHVNAEMAEGRLEEVLLGAVFQQGTVHRTGAHLQKTIGMGTGIGDFPNYLGTSVGGCSPETAVGQEAQTCS